MGVLEIDVEILDCLLEHFQPAVKPIPSEVMDACPDGAYIHWAKKRARTKGVAWNARPQEVPRHQWVSEHTEHYWVWYTQTTEQIKH